MKQWEHLSQTFEPNEPLYNERMRNLGEQGWEFVSAAPTELVAESQNPTKITVTTYVYFFKRPFQPPQPAQSSAPAVSGYRPSFEPHR